MAKNSNGNKKDSNRNDSRQNGKAFSKKKVDTKGRSLTGRGKPTGRTIKGMKVCTYYCGCPTCKRNYDIDLTRNADGILIA